MDNVRLISATIALAPLIGSSCWQLLRQTIGRVGAHGVTILSVAVSTVLSAYVLWGFTTSSHRQI